MNEDQIKDAPWFLWLARRYGAEIARKMVADIGNYALEQHKLDTEEKHRDNTGL